MEPAGERLTEAMAVRALRAACHDTGAEIRNATYRLDSGTSGNAGRYQVAVAFAGPPAPALADTLDVRLAEQCPGHRAGRRSGRIDPVEVITVQEDAFLREREGVSRYGSKGQ
jgi:hypothetical protein